MNIDSTFGFGGFDPLFSLFPILFIGLFVFILAKGLSQWHKNNNSPRLTVMCVVTDKRCETTHHSSPVGGDASGAHGFHTTTSTSYFVTFQVESGDRIELCVSGSEYGMLAEGDQGKMTFQGTRYLGFEHKSGEFDS